MTPVENGLPYGPVLIQMLRYTHIDRIQEPKGCKCSLVRILDKQDDEIAPTPYEKRDILQTMTAGECLAMAQLYQFVPP